MDGQKTSEPKAALNPWEKHLVPFVAACVGLLILAVAVGVLVAASRRSSPVERVLSTAEAERAQLQAVLQSVPGGVSGNVAVERPDVSAEGNLIKQVIKTVPRAAGAPQPSSLQEANILQSVLRSVKGNQ